MRVDKVKARSVTGSGFWHAYARQGGYWWLLKDKHGRARRFGSAQAARAAAATGRGR